MGYIADIHLPLVLVTEQGKEEESIIRLARVGYEQVIGYLEGGIENWLNKGEEIDTVTTIQAEQMSQFYNNSDYVVLDVRKPSEFDTEHVVNAINIQLSEIDERAGELIILKIYCTLCRWISQYDGSLYFKRKRI